MDYWGYVCYYGAGGFIQQQYNLSRISLPAFLKQGGFGGNEQNYRLAVDGEEIVNSIQNLNKFWGDEFDL